MRLSNLSLKYLTKWFPSSPRESGLFLSLLVVASVIWQGMFYLSHPAANLIIWLIKCHMLLDGTRIGLEQLNQFWFMVCTVMLLRSHVVNHKKLMPRSDLVKFSVMLANLYATGNLLTYIFCVYEKRITIFARKMSIYKLNFGRYDILVGRFLRSIVPPIQ